jgi:hypothetical protein
MTNDNDLLFHYTGVDGLISILKDTKIRATAASHLNDSSEMKVFSSFSSAINSISGKEAEMFETKSRILSQFIFVFCLSAEGNVLEQWRAYCPQGGFSIGFDKMKLREFAKAISGSLVKCRYLNPETDLQIDSLKEIMKDIMNVEDGEYNSRGNSVIATRIKVQT